jgi:hypothetical protein
MFTAPVPSSRSIRCHGNVFRYPLRSNKVIRHNTYMIALCQKTAVWNSINVDAKIYRDVAFSLIKPLTFSEMVRWTVTSLFPSPFLATPVSYNPFYGWGSLPDVFIVFGWFPESRIVFLMSSVAKGGIMGAEGKGGDWSLVSNLHNKRKCRK